MVNMYLYSYYNLFQVSGSEKTDEYVKYIDIIPKILSKCIISWFKATLKVE